MRKSSFMPVLLLLVSQLLFLLASCNNDEEDNPSIVGIWNFTSINVDMTIDGVSLVQFLMDELGLTSEEANDFAELIVGEYTPTGTIEFKSDNTFVVTDDGDTDTGTWSMNADGTKLTIDSSTEDAMIFDVSSLTNNSVSLSITQTDSEDMDDDGTDEVLIIDMEINLTR